MSGRADRPAHVFLDVFVECNLRCVQCDIWRLKEPAGALTVEECAGVVREVGAWGGVRLVLTGGELFLRRDRLYAVAAACREAGVYTTMNTNGTLLRASDAERLPHSGVNCVVVSLDSDEPAVHDAIRGVPGTFRRAVRAVEALVAARERARADFTVLTSTIVGAHNLHRVEEMVTLFEGLGVDTTLFQPIQPAFARTVAPQWWESDPLFPRDPALVDSGVDTLIRLKRAGRRLFQSERQFEDARRYLRGPDALPPDQCASMERHLMVDLLGNVRLCFNMERIGLTPVGNVRERGLREIWEAERAEDARRRMRGCREGCGTMLCHARE